MGEVQRYCECEWDGDKVKCELPITQPTSKVRIKRIIRKNNMEEIVPIPSRKTILGKDDYIEWQISYLYDGNLIEFGIMLKEFFSNGYLTSNEICSVLRSVECVKTFEESFNIQRDVGSVAKLGEFLLIHEKTPILRLIMSDGCFIDIVLRHKQKAVGYQAMVYIYIPMSSKDLIPINSNKSLLGRQAREKERVLWFPKKEHVVGLLKAFLIASSNHRRDIKDILNKLSVNC